VQAVADPQLFLFLADLESRRAFSTTSAVMPFSPFAGSVFTYAIGSSVGATSGDPGFRAVDHIGVALFQLVVMGGFEPASVQSARSNRFFPSRVRHRMFSFAVPFRTMDWIAVGEF